MYVYLIILFLLGSYAIKLTTIGKPTNKIISIWGGLLLFFYGALRSTSVGTDVGSYVYSYLDVQDWTFEEIYFSSSSYVYSKDPFFYIFIKLLSFVNKDPQFMLIVISAIIAISVSVFIYKNSLNPVLSFCIYICLRFYSFTLTGLRQAIALAIIMFFFNYVKEKKLIKIVFVSIVASLFHLTALVYIIACILVKMKRIEIVSIFAPLATLSSLLSINFLFYFLIVFPSFNPFETYLVPESNNSGISLVLIYSSIIIFAFLRKSQIIKDNKTFYIIYNFTMTGAAITVLNLTLPNFFRIGYYFIFPIIILLPLSINSLRNKKIQDVLNFLVVLLLVTQYIIIGPGAGTQDYMFFWQ